MSFNLSAWEVNASGGDDTNNGGGFNCNSTFASDGVVTSGTTSSPVFSTASYNFVSADIGHWLFIKSGVNWIPGWYKITAVVSNNATIDAAAGHVPWYTATTGNPVGGLLASTGCVNSSYAGAATGVWGVDYSQKSTGAAIITFADMVIQATNTTFRSAAFPVGKNYIGNVISVTGGTGWTVQRVTITSTATITATCDKALGTAGSTGGTGKMGGALATIGLAGSLAGTAQGGGVFVRSGAYTATSATVNIAGGCFSQSNAAATRLEGYNTYRGDKGTAPTFTASGINTFTLTRLSGGLHSLVNITLDGISATASIGLNHGSNFYAEKVNINNMKGGGFTSAAGTGTTLINCSGTGCATTAVFGVSGTTYFGCTAFANSITGFSKSLFCYFCISATNSGVGSHGFISDTNGGIYVNCTTYGNGGSGYSNVIGSYSVYYNCIAEANNAWGWTSTSTTTAILFNCAAYANSSGDFDAANLAGATSGVYNQISYTHTAFTNTGANDYSLNQHPQGGGLLRGVGAWGAFQQIPSTGYLDIGAVQAPWATTTYGEQSRTFVQ